LIQSIYIRNFKAWRRGVFKVFGKNSVFVGENSSGKTSILEALDFFFNRDRMDPSCAIDPALDVQIGVRINGQNYRRVYDARTGFCRPESSEADWDVLEHVNYIYIPSTGMPADVLAGKLATAKASALITDVAMEKARETVGSVFDEMMEEAGARTDPIDIGGGFSVQVVPQVDFKLADAVRASYSKEVSGAVAALSQEDIVRAICSREFQNTILAVDDVEDSLLRDCSASWIPKLWDSFSQVFLTTKIGDMVISSPESTIYAVGDKPGANVAKIISDSVGTSSTFIFVEGQYDLPWYKKAAELLGIGEKYPILPGGGSNVDILVEEFRKLGFKCAIIRDGDMDYKSNPEKLDYAIKRDCIEMYAPDKLLQDCFGIVPKRRKDRFFKDIIANRGRFSREVRSGKKSYSFDDIKAIIADKIPDYMDERNPLVSEFGEIIEDIERRL
jgi:hypothetical protein